MRASRAAGASAGPLRVVSWNVNGLRACAAKGFLQWLQRSRAHVVGLQEVRAAPDQLPPELAAPRGWHVHFAPAQRPGYSGVALYARRPFAAVETSLGLPEFDAEGRVQLARTGRLLIANVYFPNGSGKERDNGRVPFKLEFYRTLHRRLERERARGLRVLVMGDFNTAHRAIDLARPRENRATSGFLPEECAELDRWVASGWHDTFRLFEDRGGHYSWWSQRQGARQRNVGWRIDYVFACAAARPFVRGAALHPKVQGSDHCPVSVDVEAGIAE